MPLRRLLNLLLLAGLPSCVLAASDDLSTASAVHPVAGPTSADAAAQFAQGERHRQAKNYEQARHWFGLSAAQGNSDGMRGLGLLYLFGAGGPPDIVQGLALLQQAATLGDAVAMYFLGEAYDLGTDVAQDLALARAWYKRSADAGDDDARFRLAELLEEGLGGEIDRVEAIRLYRAAAVNDHKDSIYALAWAYARGHGVEQESAEARRWIEKGVALNDGRAMALKGEFLLLGIGGPIDRTGAFALLERAAESGSPNGIFWFANCLEHGLGTVRDEARALAQYRQAALKGNNDARSRLIAMIMQGRGTARDTASAWEMIELDLAAGHVKRIVELATVLIKENDPDDGEAVAQRLMRLPEVQRRESGFAAGLGEIGAAFLAKLDYARAEQWLDRQMALLEQYPDSDPAQAATVLTLGLDRLASLHSQRGNAHKAHALYERSLRAKIAAHGEESLAAAMGYSHLSYASMSLDRYADAERLQRRSFAITERMRGYAHESTEHARARLAQILYAVGKYREAEPLFVWLRTAAETRLGETHPSLGGKLHNAAHNDMELGNYQEAEKGFRRALALGEAGSDGTPQHGVATVLAGLGDLLTRAGRTDEAEPLLSRSLAIREALTGGVHHDVAMSLAALGRLYLATGRHAEAEMALTRAHSMLAKESGAERWEISGIEYHQALNRRAQGKRAEARALLADAFATRLHIQPHHPATRLYATTLSGLDRDMGDEAAAQQVEQQLKSARDAAVF